MQEDPNVNELDLHVVWILSGIQLSGLVSGFMVRLSHRSRGEGLCQWVFLACLGAVGIATYWSLRLSPFAWMACGTTLCAMVLMAIWDFGPHPHTSNSR